MTRARLALAWLVAVCLAFPIAAPPIPQLQPAAATAPPVHGMGLRLAGFGWAQHGARAAGSATTPAGVPASVDLSLYLPPIGDQGQVGSCASWAATYYALGWWANRLGYYPAFGFAPMYTYSRIVSQFDNGQDAGSTIEGPFQLLQQHGAAPESRYPQGYYDFRDLPTAAEDQAAAPFAAAGYRTIWTFQSAQDPQVAVESALAAGEPVVISLAVTMAYHDYGPGSPPVPGYIQGEPVLGGHANFIYGYGPDGAYAANQWGSQWGRQGRVVLSWDFLRTAVGQATELVPGSGPVAPATATSTPPAPAITPTVPLTPTATIPAPTASATAAISPTATLTPAPTATPIRPLPLVLWHPAAPALPAALPAGRYTVVLAVRDQYGRTRALAYVKATKH